MKGAIANSESRDDPRRHIRSRAPGLRCLRQKETVATDTLFPSIISDRGNTCLQILWSRFR